MMSDISSDEAIAVFETISFLGGALTGISAVLWSEPMSKCVAMIATTIVLFSAYGIYCLEYFSCV